MIPVSSAQYGILNQIAEIFSLGKDVNLPHSRVFIVSWVDYCNKYGMGYALTDGTVGVSFNDNTSILLSPDKACANLLSLPTSRC